MLRDFVLATTFLIALNNKVRRRTTQTNAITQTVRNYSNLTRS